MAIVEEIKSELATHINPEKAIYFPKYFQAYPGGYGEGDQFIGVKVPDQRKVAKKFFRKIELAELQSLLQDPVHEHRLTALFILTYKYEKSKIEEEQQCLVDFYLDNLDYVNNWDLVDSSADKILGPYLLDKDKSILYDLAKSGLLWHQRVAIITTHHFIKKHQFDDTLKIATLLLNHEHDLIHKAAGWMLREVGDKDFTTEYNFLKQHYQKMPRTMLRYAIEKFDPDLRQQFLKGLI